MSCDDVDFMDGCAANGGSVILEGVNDLIILGGVNHITNIHTLKFDETDY